MTISYISVPVSTSSFIRLAGFLKEQGSDRDPVDAISTAIEYWMDNASWKREALLPEVEAARGGIYWQDLYLAERTKLRMKYKGKMYLAEVGADAVQYEGKDLSPSGFANTVTGTQRNAWNDLEVLRPGDTQWIPANQLRNKPKY